MNIHAELGFDPCGLFMGEKGLASLDPTKIAGSHGRINETGGIYGLGGPAAPTSDPVTDDTERVDARAVAPTITDMLGVSDALEDAAVEFECRSPLADRSQSRIGPLASVVASIATREPTKLVRDRLLFALVGFADGRWDPR